MSVPCESIFNNIYGALRSELLRVAVDLNIFDALAGSQSQGKGKTASQLSSELSLMQDRVNRFLRALVSLGLLELRDDGFHNTAASEVYLVSTSPLCVTDAVQFMRYTTGFYHDELTAVLQGKGHLDNESYGYDQEARYQSGGEEFVQLFSRGMLAIAHTDMDCLQHVDFIGCDTVIDLGGSLGWHARAIKKLHPHVNHVIVADLADVVKVGKALEENRNAGIEYTIVNFLSDDSLPRADAYLLSHLVHDYGDTEVKCLLAKVHNALTEDGQLVVLESVMTSEKTGPFPAVMNDQVMLLRTAGKERSGEEYERLLADCGFSNFHLTRMEGGALYDVMTVRKKPAASGQT